MENTLKLLEILTPIIKSIVWPIFLFALIVWLRKPLKLFFGNISEFKIKAAGVEASAVAPREQIKAAAFLGAASLKNSTESGNEVDTGEIAEAVSGFVGKADKQEPARILWVDDRPSNNYYVREAFEQMGIEFGIARDTDEALSKLQASHYDLIISDMGRPPDSRAGYTLLDRLRGMENTIPFVIYAGSRNPAHQKESKEHGALGCTNRADELFVLVSQGLVVASR